MKARRDTVAYRTGKLFRAAPEGGGCRRIARRRRWRWRLAGAALCVACRRAKTASAAPEVAPFTTFQGNREAAGLFARRPQASRSFGAARKGRELRHLRANRSMAATLRRITTDAAEDVSPAWSPDGRRIALLRTEQKHARPACSWLALAGGIHGKVARGVSPNRVEAVGRHLDWSPDGQWLAVADKRRPGSPSRSTWMRRGRRCEKQMLTAPPPRAPSATAARRSRPTAKWISFLRSPSSGITELYVAPDRRRRGAAPDVRQPRRSQPDLDAGRQRAGLLLQPHRRLLPLADRRRAGGTPRRVPGIGEGASEPAFSRDGRHMAYSQFFAGCQHLAV